MGNIDLGNDVKVCGGGWIYGRGKLSIGNGTWLSPGVRIYTHLDAPIVMGACCDIGPQVSFVTGSHQIGGANRRAGLGLANPITVEAGCWIGAGAMILGGVTIGASSVVAAGAIVIRSIPRNSLVGGVPARLIRHLVP